MTPVAAVRRVLLTADAVGGVWTYALELAAGLGARGVLTLVAVLGPPPSPAETARAVRIPGLRLAVTGLELEWRDREGLRPRAARRLHGIARDFAPDLVQINGFREAACDWDVPVVLVAHSCVRSWWRACRGGEPPLPEWAAYLEGVRAGFAAADAVVAPTRAFLDQMTALYGPLPRATVIHNGRDLAWPAGAGEGGRRPCILAAGRLWDEAKNVAALARIAPRLPWPVLVAGEPPAAGAPAGLAHLGRLEPLDLLARMEEAEIFAAPARYEPFGLAILEAAAAGAALVLGDVATLRELWDGAARFVPPDEPEALLATLRELARDAPARAALQAAARARAAHYGRAAMTERYLTLYGELLAARRAARGAAA